MQSKRRSGRIAKEIPIVLLGTDTSGKVFSEETKTVVLSRHGAGIISRHIFQPDEILSLRLPGSSKEAEIRLVGKIGGDSGRHVYGVAFVDPDLRFWPMEFPPPDPDEPSFQRMPLECSLCHMRQEVEQQEIEEDVYSVNGSVLRYCQSCGTSTPWKKAQCEAIPQSVSSSSADSVHAANAPAPASTPPVPQRPSSQAGVISRQARSESPGPPASLVSFPSAYSGSFNEELLTTAAVIEPPPSVVAPSAPPPAASEAGSVRSKDASGRLVNRRKHIRIRVSFSACVRHPVYPDEVVECENVSKGGLCFHSDRQYSVGSLIEVAAPYSPGETALFVPAQIKRVEALPGRQAFRYGAAYTSPSSQ